MPYKSIAAQKKNSRKYYLKNRKRILNKVAKYRVENHEKVLACQRECYRKNPSVMKEYQKKYYADNQKVVDARNKDYSIKHRQEIKAWSKSRVAANMFYHAKRRAKLKGYPFNISLDDIVIPKRCPALGCLMTPGTHQRHEQSPTLDKIIPSLGYVKGNIQVICHRANWLKGNASLKELKLLVHYVTRVTKK
jgi:hypothetical protein